VTGLGREVATILGTNAPQPCILGLGFFGGGWGGEELSEVQKTPKLEDKRKGELFLNISGGENSNQVQRPGMDCSGEKRKEAGAKQNRH